MTVLYSDDFEGADGTSIGTTGSGTVKLTTTSPIVGTSSAKASAAAGQTAILLRTIAAVTELWDSVVFRVPASLPAQVYVRNIANGGTKAVDYRFNADLSMTVRDNNTAAWSSPALTPGQLVRCSLFTRVGTTPIARLRMYVGGNLNGSSPTYDSGEFALSSTLTVLTSIREGITVATAAGTGTIDVVYDRTRGDTAEPTFTSSNAAPTVSLAASVATADPFSSVSLTATAADTDGTIASYSFRQIAVTSSASVAADYTAPEAVPTSSTVTLTGSGNARSFAVPSLRAQTTLRFGVVVTDNTGAQSSEATVDVVIAPTKAWAAGATAEVPVQVRGVGMVPTSAFDSAAFDASVFT